MLKYEKHLYGFIILALITAWAYQTKTEALTLARRTNASSSGYNSESCAAYAKARNMQLPQESADRKTQETIVICNDQTETLNLHYSIRTLSSFDLSVNQKIKIALTEQKQFSQLFCQDFKTVFWFVPKLTAVLEDGNGNFIVNVPFERKDCR